MLRVDLNCDMGEGVGNDIALMPHITSANIACGGHAGDDMLMRETLLLAAAHGVAAGAHPGYPDRDNFGRSSMGLSPGEIYDTVVRQIGALLSAARSAGVPVAHVKPHGALYNDAAGDAHAAQAIVRAVRDTDAGLLLYALAGSALMTEAERLGLRAVGEAFADRGYEPDGTLTPRDTAGALIDDPSAAAARVLGMVTQNAVTCSDGSDISVHAGTVCIHGDGAHAVQIAVEVRRVLADAGVRVVAPDHP
ncbi:MAG: 5-oxoprolinase subunit PxpA [Longimicrobiales bacterium]